MNDAQAVYDLKDRKADTINLNIKCIQRIL